MNHFVRRPWDLHQKQHTPAGLWRNRRLARREFLRAMGIGAAGMGIGSHLVGCGETPTDEQIHNAGRVELSESAKAVFVDDDVKPADNSNAPDVRDETSRGVTRNENFEYGRPETNRRYAAEYTNFYEFSPYKDSWKLVDDFEPLPWKFEVDGLCSKPRTFDIDDVYRLFEFEERAYRHRCVETWAMCVPWTGFELRRLLKLVEPQPSAKFVSFETMNRPEQCPGIRSSPQYPWPYTEGLTIDEAISELTLLVTGIYGEPLPKQHGTPIRLVVPWKYGFKSIKSIVRITLTDRKPATFWNTLAPQEYGFEANVDPEVRHPRWSQAQEWMLNGTDGFGFVDRSVRYPTLKYNGYGEYVAKLYEA